MLTGSSMEELRARLRPWHAPLRALDSIAGPCEAGSGKQIRWPSVLWLEAGKLALPSFASSLPPLDHICEALALFTLLSRIDVAAWKRELMEIWPGKSMKYWAEDQSTSLPSFRMGLHFTEIEDATTLAIIHAHAVSTDGPSAEYMELSAHLQALIASKLGAGSGGSGGPARVTVPVCVELDLFQKTADQTPQGLNKILRLAKTHRSSVVANLISLSPTRPLFAIEEVAFATTIDVVMNMHALRYLQQFASLGVRISNLPEMEEPLYDENPQLVVGALRSLLTLDTTAPSWCYGVDSLLLRDKAAQYYIPALLSAAQHSPSLHTVDIQLGADQEEDDLDYYSDRSDQTVNWKWAAYTLFSKHASHHITTLEMDLEFLEERDVQAVRDVLASKNPRRLLCAHAEPPYSHISASRFYLTDPIKEVYDQGKHARPRPRAVYTSPHPITTTSFYQDEKKTWWCVLLPGWGEAWVHPDDVISQTKIKDTAVKQSLPSFGRIEITKISSEASTACASLLGIIGHGTRRIDVLEQLGEDDVLDAWCHQVLLNCPKLEEFFLAAAVVENLQVIVDAAVARPDKTHGLRSLTMPQIHPTKPEHVLGFLQALGDPSHPLAVHLQEMSLTFHVEEPAHMAIFTEPIVAMLEHNRRLFDIRVNVSCGIMIEDDDDEEFAQREQAIEAQVAEWTRVYVKCTDHTDVVIRTAPLELSKKLAFLSAVFTDSESEYTAIHRLDSLASSLIFQFAAHSRTRKVEIHFG